METVWGSVSVFGNLYQQQVFGSLYQKSVFVSLYQQEENLNLRQLFAVCMVVVQQEVACNNPPRLFHQPCSQDQCGG